MLRHLDDRPPDWAIATEPTGLRLVTRHKGVAQVRLVAEGLAGHASQPQAGRNAIVALSQAVLALEELGTKLARSSDPDLGPATLSVGIISGGSAPNIIPNEASLILDRRFLPTEDPEDVRAQIENALSERGIAGVRLDWCRLEKFPLLTRDARHCVRTCQQVLADAGLPTDTIGASFGTDSGIFDQHGVASVVLGPGAIEQAHSACEWVAVDQVEGMRDLLVRLFETA